MRRITGTHIYSLVECEHRATLDLHLSRDERRELRVEEEFVRRRGRDFEDRYVETLGWPEPSYEPRDWDAAMAATLELLRAGVEGVSQGVLFDDDCLGIPDLLRREPGQSAFGDWHYVPGDVKTSARPRSDQVLQVAFYGRLLAGVQDRAPEYGYLILKDGREERFPLADYSAALQQVLERAMVLRQDPDRTRPFWHQGCERCHWSDRCAAALGETDDLSLVDGMTPGLRRVLETERVESSAALVAADVEGLAAATRIERPLLRRLQRAASVRRAGLPERQSVPPQRQGPGSYVHLLTDPYSERLLWIGALCDGEFTDACPADAEGEWAATKSVLDAVPDHARILHYGRSLPTTYERLSWDRADAPWLDERFVDVRQKLRGAAVWPGPAFELADHVRFGIDHDPHRAGRSDAAAWHAEEGEGTQWLMAKGRADLEDLAALGERWLETR